MLLVCLPVLAYFLFILLLAKYTCSEDDKKPMMSFNNSRDFPSQKNHFPSTRPSESTCYIKGKRTGFPRGLTHYFAKKSSIHLWNSEYFFGMSKWECYAGKEVGRKLCVFWHKKVTQSCYNDYQRRQKNCLESNKIFLLCKASMYIVNYTAYIVCARSFHKKIRRTAGKLPQGEKSI